MAQQTMREIKLPPLLQKPAAAVAVPLERDSGDNYKYMSRLRRKSTLDDPTFQFIHTSLTDLIPGLSAYAPAAAHPFAFVQHKFGF